MATYRDDPEVLRVRWEKAAKRVEQERRALSPEGRLLYAARLARIYAAAVATFLLGLWVLLSLPDLYLNWDWAYESGIERKYFLEGVRPEALLLLFGTFPLALIVYLVLSRGLYQNITNKDLAPIKPFPGVEVDIDILEQSQPQQERLSQLQKLTWLSFLWPLALALVLVPTGLVCMSTLQDQPSDLRRSVTQVLLVTLLPLGAMTLLVSTASSWLFLHRLKEERWVRGFSLFTTFWVFLLSGFLMSRLGGIPLSFDTAGWSDSITLKPSEAAFAAGILFFPGAIFSFWLTKRLYHKEEMIERREIWRLKQNKGILTGGEVLQKK